MSEKKIGILGRIKFQKDAYMIAEFSEPQTSNSGDPFRSIFPDTFTVLGDFYTIKPGMTYEMIGNWKPNTYNGRTTKQFHVQSARMITPTDVKGIYRYLVNTASFVGSAIGNQLVDRYEEKTLEILKTDPARVASEINHLSLARAETIAEQLRENDELESIMVELQSLIGGLEGIPKSLIPKLIEKYGMSAVEQLRKNPYILTEFPRIGFLTADRIAQEVFMVTPDSVFRQAACVSYVISNIRMEGNIWADESIIRIRVTKQINVKNIDSGIERLIEKNVIVRNGSFLAFCSDDKNEKYIADCVNQMGQYVFDSDNTGDINDGGEDFDYDDI